MNGKLVAEFLGLERLKYRVVRLYQKKISLGYSFRGRYRT